MSAYHASIIAATGVTDPAMLEEIEDTMRHDIFHSTLDWQTRAQLQQGARDALELIRIMANPAAVAAILGMIPA
jgi:hypothetical protein